MEMRSNSYPGVCTECGTSVAAHEGVLHKNPVNDRWQTKHKPGDCPEAKLPTKADTGSTSINEGVDKAVGLIAAKFMEMVPALVAENMVLASRVAAVQIGKAPPVKVDKAHNILPTIVTALCAGINPFMVGPAGSGKTTIAEQVADVMKLKFYMASRVTSDFKLLGFMDATGKLVRTAFRDCYEKGGVFLFDEVDASDADALTAFNAALSNGICDFPDGAVRKHKDFHAVAAGNTFGRGADRQYVGRTQLDAATLDRFAVFEVDYDEQLELEIAGNNEWVRKVQGLRASAKKAGVRHIISPRASISGARLLAAGMDEADVLEAVVWKGLDKQNRVRIESDSMMSKMGAGA